MSFKKPSRNPLVDYFSDAQNQFSHSTFILHLYQLYGFEEKANKTL